MSALHSADYQLFLERLIAARKAAKLSQVEVAREIGKPQSFISKCESGERRMDIVELALVARLYGKQLDYFVDMSRKRKIAMRKRAQKIGRIDPKK